jgi:hypothetical protein
MKGGQGVEGRLVQPKQAGGEDISTCTGIETR